jgi:hypothetical protein
MVQAQKDFHAVLWNTGQAYLGLALHRLNPDYHLNGNSLSCSSLPVRAREIQQQEGVPTIFWSSSIGSSNSSPSKTPAEPTIPEGNASFAFYISINFDRCPVCRVLT